MLIMSFSNVPKKKKEKERKKIIFSFYIIYICIACVPCHDSLFFVCVCGSFLHFSIARQKKKKKYDDRLINYAYICTWMHVHGRHLQETVLWDAITCSEFGKTYRIYNCKLKRSIPTCYH